MSGLSLVKKAKRRGSDFTPAKRGRLAVVHEDAEGAPAADADDLDDPISFLAMLFESGVGSRLVAALYRASTGDIEVAVFPCTISELAWAVSTVRSAAAAPSLECLCTTNFPDSAKVALHGDGDAGKLHVLSPYSFGIAAAREALGRTTTSAWERAEREAQRSATLKWAPPSSAKVSANREGTVRFAALLNEQDELLYCVVGGLLAHLGANDVLKGDDDTGGDNTGAGMTVARQSRSRKWLYRGLCASFLLTS